MNRDDKSEVTSPSLINKNLENAVSGKLILRIYMSGLTTLGKGVAFTNIVITGNVEGTPVDGTTYTITAAPDAAGHGVVSGGGAYAANEEGTLYAAPKTGYVFTKWLKGGADFEGNTSASIAITATADVTYTAVFAEQKSITYNANGGAGTVPATGYVLAGENFDTETPYLLYKSGYTFSGWNTAADGSGMAYAAGATIENITENITLYAQWEANTKVPGDGFTTVNWTFARADGAPTITCEGNETNYVQQVTIAGVAYDAIMHINTKQDAGVSGSKGKVNNTSNTAYAQVNKGTIFSIPAVNGMIVRYIATQAVTAVNAVGFTDNGTDISSQSLANANSVANNILTYQYTGNGTTLYIVDLVGGKYPSGITVTYPGSGEELISTLSGRNYASYVTSQKLDFASAEGITAYIATGYNAGKTAIVLSSVDVVPAGTPIIVKTETKGATVNVPLTDSDASSVEGNALVAGDGTTAWDGTDGYTYYYLASDLFHQATSGTLQSGKAYLKVLTSEVPAAARSFSFVFDDEATAIQGVETVTGKTAPRKVVKNGRVVIETSEGTFTLSGARVQ